MREVCILIVAFMISGCGVNDNLPIVGDVVKIEVESSSSKIYATQQAQLDTTASFSLGLKERNITEDIYYDSSNTTVATVDDNGLVKGAEGGGVVTITGWYRGFSDHVDIEVIPLVSVQILSNETNLTLQKSIDLNVSGTFEDNVSFDVTDDMSWILSLKPDESNASLEQNGSLYSGDKNGTLQVDVLRYDINDSIKLYVK